MENIIGRENELARHMDYVFYGGILEKLEWLCF